MPRIAQPLSDADAARLRTSDRPGSITCRAAGTTATLLLYGEIGWEVTALGVTQALAAAGPVSTLDIRICSIGGSVVEGWAIYNVLARHLATVKTVTIEGLAASMASVIAMCGTEIVMPANSYMMIHNPSGFCSGEADDMRIMADLLDHMRGVAVQVYAGRSGQPTATVEALVDAETYMTADLALSLGFADRIEQPLEMAARLDLTKLPTLPPLMRAALTKETHMATKPSTNEPAAPANPAAPAAPAGGDPGALPAGTPDGPRPTPPASPGYGPADPVEVAEMCERAGFAMLTAPLLRSRATAAMVQAEIARAQAITTAAAGTNQAAMAEPAIKGGVDLETFRAMAFAAKAGSEGQINTAVPASQGPAGQPAPLKASDVYARANSAHLPVQRRA